jgi:hypothetical protein
MIYNNEQSTSNIQRSIQPNNNLESNYNNLIIPSTRQIEDYNNLIDQSNRILENANNLIDQSNRILENANNLIDQTIENQNNIIEHHAPEVIKHHAPEVTEQEIKDILLGRAQFVSKETSCPICMSEISNLDFTSDSFVFTTRCGHSFCIKCITDWVLTILRRERYSQVVDCGCPICRSTFYTHYF